MGRLVADITMSLDGFITGPDDAPGRCLGQRSAGARIIGRRMFNVTGGGGGNPLARESGCSTISAAGRSGSYGPR